MEHGDDDNNHGKWSWEENKMFENAVGAFGNEPASEMFAMMAMEIPGKTMDEIKDHYIALLQDVHAIDTGSVPLPRYTDDINETPSVERGKALVDPTSYQPRKANRGVPWTQEEHEMFLMGLEKYGKGDWRSISRHCVHSKTPIQVASHAQKHFLKLERAAAAQLNPKPPKAKKAAGGSKRGSASASTSLPLPDHQSQQPLAVEKFILDDSPLPFIDFSDFHQQPPPAPAHMEYPGSIPYGGFSDNQFSIAHASMAAAPIPYGGGPNNQFPTDFNTSIADPNYDLSQLTMDGSSITATAPPPYEYDPLSQLMAPSPPLPSLPYEYDSNMFDPSYGGFCTYPYPPP